jgi:NADPH:quinone reductase-like Zn-dependent oxidoreductase
MMPLLGAGKLKTVIDRVFPLQEAADAHRYLESAKQFGKVVLRVNH